MNADVDRDLIKTFMHYRWQRKAEARRASANDTYCVIGRTSIEYRFIVTTVRA